MSEFSPGEFLSYGTPITTQSRYAVKERVDLFALLPSGMHARSILEIGCADGANIRFFARGLSIAPDRCVGVDICRSANAEPSSFRFVHASAETFFDSCNDQFDVILLSDVLEHIYNPWRLLKRAKCCLSSAGALLVSVPNLQNLRYLMAVASGEFNYESTGLFDETHIRFFSRASLRRCLESCGFRVQGASWRPDLGLESVRANARQSLDSTGTCKLKLGQLAFELNAQRLDEVCGQQVLMLATHA